MLRISSGYLKGKKIYSGKIFSKKSCADELRPTSAKVREAIFDILQCEIKGAIFLDLYAGTGSVGLEALSRGAKSVFFVENNNIHSKTVRDYVSKIGYVHRTHVYNESAYDFLKRALHSGMIFDLIFADPPYASDEITKVIIFLEEYNVLREGGSIIVEHSSKAHIHEHTQSLRFVKKYKYGDTMLTLFRKGK